MATMRCSMLVAALADGLSLGGCGRKEEKKGPPPGALITVAQAVVRDVPMVERSVGEADSSAAPKVGAEVAGRVVKIYVETGDPVKQGQVLAELDATGFSADAKGLEALHVAAREQHARAAKSLARTRIASPVKGRVENRFVSVGGLDRSGQAHLPALHPREPAHPPALSGDGGGAHPGRPGPGNGAPE